MRFPIGSQFQSLTKALLLFGPPNLCAKFHQYRTEIATVGARTDRQTDRRTEVILFSAPCYAIAVGQMRMLYIDLIVSA